jgi:uncharacterized protein (UPF0548 family)
MPLLRYSISPMLFLRRPSNQQIHMLMVARRVMPFSYPEIGATRSTPPPGYRINHMRALLGTGKELHDRAVKSLLRWQLLAPPPKKGSTRSAALQLFPDDPPMRPQTNVALLSRHFGVWSLDFCRVVYVLNSEPEKNGSIERTGFAYGTLPGHAVRGEEIFSIEFHSATQEVWYEIFSFSQPANSFIRLAGPLARRAQLRFAAASLQAAGLSVQP